MPNFIHMMTNFILAMTKLNFCISSYINFMSLLLKLYFINSFYVIKYK